MKRLFKLETVLIVGNAIRSSTVFVFTRAQRDAIVSHTRKVSTGTIYVTEFKSSGEVVDYQYQSDYMGYNEPRVNNIRHMGSDVYMTKPAMWLRMDRESPLYGLVKYK